MATEANYSEQYITVTDAQLTELAKQDEGDSPMTTSEEASDESGDLANQFFEGNCSHDLNLSFGAQQEEEKTVVVNVQ